MTSVSVPLQEGIQASEIKTETAGDGIEVEARVPWSLCKVTRVRLVRLKLQTFLSSVISSDPS